MEPIRRIQRLEQFKLLGDPRRLLILQKLMSGPQTLSSLGKALGEHPARVRHHLKLLEQAGFIELVEVRTGRGFTEKYYYAHAQALIYHGLILPEVFQQEHSGGARPIVALGSHDLALELLAEQMRGDPACPNLLVLPVGSLDGLIALRQGLGQLAGVHLYDPTSGDYNLPYVRRIFPDRPVRVVSFVERTQGLLLPPGNPLNLKEVSDLARPGVQLMNRNPGSGTYLWLHQEIRRLGITQQQIRGWENQVVTHSEMGEAIARGKANAGIGLQAVAAPFGLDFVPLFEERFDLVLLESLVQDPAGKTLLEWLNDQGFRRQVAQLDGYNPSKMGEIRLLTGASG